VGGREKLNMTLGIGRRQKSNGIDHIKKGKRKGGETRNFPETTDKKKNGGRATGF